jgi:hypothetical protein
MLRLQSTTMEAALADFRNSIGVYPSAADLNRRFCPGRCPDGRAFARTAGENWRAAAALHNATEHPFP